MAVIAGGRAVRRIDWRLAGAVALVGVVCLLWLTVAAVMLRTVLDPADWRAIIEALGGRGGLLLFLWALALMPVSWALRHLFEYHVLAPARLAEQTRAILAAGVHQPLVPAGSAETRDLTVLVNELVAQREAMRCEMGSRVEAAIREVELQRRRLAALMSELTKSVVVCNLDGRILLYNNRARLQFSGLSKAAGLTGGAELIGLGRSVYTVLDRRLVTHALENVERRLRRGAAHPAAQFVTTTPTGRLLRVHMTPVREDDDTGVAAGDGAALISGFVLLIENITAQLGEAAERDRQLTGFAQRGGAALDAAKTATEELARADPAAMEGRITSLAQAHEILEREIAALIASPALAAAAWPLEDMLGEEFLESLARRIRVDLQLEPEVQPCDPVLWLKVESFWLTEAALHLARRLLESCEGGALSLALARAPHAAAQAQDPGEALAEGPDAAMLTLGCRHQCEGPAPDVAAWLDDAISIAGEAQSLTMREVLARHGGVCRLEQPAQRGGQEDASVVLHLPLAAPQDELPAASFVRHDSRPEYYDFDLFHASALTSRLEDRPLAELAYTVFDTETTGLEPSRGDEILQLGAVRIVNARVLAHECFDQLVDPGRGIPAAGIPIHGITPQMVAGQPLIGEVLPAFHAFCRDTVLVAHNAAFDMRFLELKQAHSGVVFDQPVLDTLLLSAVVHEHQRSHRLEAIAARFGLQVIGRHTAIGDALLTAEIFLRLMPLLATRGIHTLGQALEVSRQTYFARQRY